MSIIDPTGMEGEPWWWTGGSGMFDGNGNQRYDPNTGEFIPPEYRTGPNDSHWRGFSFSVIRAVFYFLGIRRRFCKPGIFYAPICC
jgi:hypothetical protein